MFIVKTDDQICGTDSSIIIDNDFDSSNTFPAITSVFIVNPDGFQRKVQELREVFPNAKWQSISQEESLQFAKVRDVTNIWYKDGNYVDFQADEFFSHGCVLSIFAKEQIDLANQIKDEMYGKKVFTREDLSSIEFLHDSTKITLKLPKSIEINEKPQTLMTFPEVTSVVCNFAKDERTNIKYFFPNAEVKYST